MKSIRKAFSSKSHRGFDRRLTAYVAAAGAVGTAMASDANAIVVSNFNVQPVGVNGFASIDFNSDGQTDFQIDHDRVDLSAQSGPVLDYLQIDKNDVNGESNPLAFDPGPGCCFAATPFSDGASARNDANNSAYVITGPQGSYPASLPAGTLIGPTSTFDWQESDNFQGGGKWIRANRLIDEDRTQIDQVLGGRPASGVYLPTNGPNFTGFGSQVQYVGVKMELNDTGLTNYGWIGVRILNETDATAEVIGYAYETLPDVPIGAGVPEPGSLLMALMGCAAFVGAFLRRRFRRS